MGNDGNPPEREWVLKGHWDSRGVVECVLSCGSLYSEKDCCVARHYSWVEIRGGGERDYGVQYGTSGRLTNNPLFQIFMDVRKSYLSLDKGL